MASIVDSAVVRAEAEQRKRLSTFPPPRYVDFATLDAEQPPEREWTVADWLPRGTVTTLFGAGGAGKSLLVQQVATHVANGIPIFEKAVSTGPVLGFLCEDDDDELRRRQRALLAHMGRSASMSSADLYLQGRAGQDNVIASFDARRKLQTTPFADMIEREIERLGPVLVVLDNIAQMYGGAENDRHQVTAFCNLLAGWARRYNCAVLLLGHVAKVTGSEFSGSTAWEAAVRTRLWLDRRPDGMVELHRKKANYAAQGSALLEYRYGAFAEVTDATGAADSFAVAQAEADVLRALDTLTGRQIATSHNPNARTYLPRLAQRESLLNGTALPNACRALANLIDRGEIMATATLPWRTSTRHQAVGIARKGQS